MANEYATLAQIKQRRDPDTSRAWSSAEEAAIDAARLAVSRAIDNYCGRRFYAESSVTREFTPTWLDLLVIPDLATLTTLKTDTTGDGSFDTTWAAADYLLEPENAADISHPFTQIRVSTLTGSAAHYFPLTRRSVEIAGTWGWPAVPGPVYEVCVLETLRVLQQAESPSGVVASAELLRTLVVPAMHPTSKMMLAPYRRVRVGVATGLAYA